MLFDGLNRLTGRLGTLRGVRSGLTSALRGARRRSWATAAVLLALAFALRIAEVQRSSYRPVHDAVSYLALGAQVAELGDYSPRAGGAGGTLGPSAYFPPGYPYFLAVVDRLTDQNLAIPAASAHAARVAQALIGTVLVGLIALVALELLGPGIALTALAIAAVYPPLIETSSVIVAETLETVFELAAVYAALRAARSYDHPVTWVAICGVLAGLTALTHVNGILLLVPLAFAVTRVRPVIGRRLIYPPTLLLGVAALILLPWLIRDTVELHTFVPISDEAGITLVGTYNPASAAAVNPPWRWRYYAQIPADRGLASRAATLSEKALDTKLEGRALSYIAKHPAAPFEVAFDNTLRLLDLEGAAAWRDSAMSIGIPLGLARIGVIGFWLVALLALGGALTRTVRAVPRWVWGVALVTWLSIVLVNAETPRFREPLEPFVVMLAACGLASITRLLGIRAESAPEEPEPADS